MAKFANIFFDNLCQYTRHKRPKIKIVLAGVFGPINSLICHGAGEDRKKRAKNTHFCPRLTCTANCRILEQGVDNGN
jgi:hypothetical protein